MSREAGHLWPPLSLPISPWTSVGWLNHREPPAPGEVLVGAVCVLHGLKREEPGLGRKDFGMLLFGSLAALLWRQLLGAARAASSGGSPGHRRGCGLVSCEMTSPENLVSD